MIRARPAIHLACLGLAVVACSAAFAARARAAERSVSTIDEARAVLAADYVGSPPLFYTQAALDAAGLTVLSVAVSSGADPGATVFYAPIDGGDLNGQLWMSVSDTMADVPGSFGTASCGGHERLGPQQLGPFTTWLVECDISRMYRFNWLDHGYTSATKYYGGLSAEGLAGITGAMTPVSSGPVMTPKITPPAATPRTGRRARARKRCRKLHNRHRRARCLRRANRLPR